MELKFFRKKEKPLLVLDVGTEAVKSLIVKKNNNKIDILSSSVCYFEDSGVFNQTLDQQEFEMEIIKRTVLKAIEETFSNFTVFEKGEKIKKPADLPVLISLPPNILRAEIVNYKIKRENKKLRISSKEKQKTYNQALEDSKQRIIEKTSKLTGLMPKEIEITSSNFLEKQIDGYVVSEIEKYQGENIVFKIMIIFAIRPYLQSIKKVFDDLNLNILRIIHLAETFPFSFTRVKNGVFCDIGGKASQVFFLKKGILEKIKYFNKGGENFTEKIFETLNISESEARNLKEKYSANLLSPEIVKRIKEILSQENNNWNGFLKNYKGFDFFLFGGSSSLPEIKSHFGNRKVVLPKSFKRVNDLTKKTKSSQFVPAILISLTQ